MTKPPAWDASAYHDVASVQLEWGLALIDRHDWKGDERVLDAGCGTGRLAQAILKRHPQTRVVAMDVEPGMVEEAERTLRGHTGRAHVLEGDVMSLPVQGPFDLVVSNAVLHWVPDHQQAYREFCRVLRPGGRLLASYGGQGNLQGVHEAARDVLDEAPFFDRAAAVAVQWNYEDARTTRDHVEAAGLEAASVRHERVDVNFNDEASWRRFLQVVTLRSFLRAIPPELHDAFIDRYMDLAKERGLGRRLDFQRLFVDAHKPA